MIGSSIWAETGWRRGRSEFMGTPIWRAGRHVKPIVDAPLKQYNLYIFKRDKTTQYIDGMAQNAACRMYRQGFALKRAGRSCLIHFLSVADAMRFSPAGRTRRRSRCGHSLPATYFFCQDANVKRLGGPEFALNRCADIGGLPPRGRF